MTRKAVEPPSQGFVQLHREIRLHWIWRDSDKLKWWLDILMEANYADNIVPIGFTPIECKRGQTINSLKTWSLRWAVDVSTVRRFINLLKNANMIEVENVQKTTRITICNYDSYNSWRHATQSKSNSDAIPTQSQRNTNNKDNKDNKENNNILSLFANNEAELDESKEKYKSLLSSFGDQATRQDVWLGLKKFIETEKPMFHEPYFQIWNIFADSLNLSKIQSMADSRKQKLKTRLSSSAFDFLKILEKIKSSAHLKGQNERNWKVTFDWIVENDRNYLKILEGNYEQ